MSRDGDVGDRRSHGGGVILVWAVVVIAMREGKKQERGRREKDIRELREL